MSHEYDADGRKLVWHIVGATVLAGSVVFAAHFFKSDATKEILLHVIFALVVFGVSLVTFRFHALAQRLENSQNAWSNKALAKLVATNAVVENRDGYMAMTAAQLSAFPESQSYSPPQGAGRLIESIDLIRSYRYQNLLFTPKYLIYFFHRAHGGGSQANAKRIVIAETDCSAAMVYTLLCVLCRTETYLICGERFRQFVDKYPAPDQSSRDAMRAMIKGNPYVERFEGDTLVCRYCDLKARAGGGEVKEFKDARRAKEMLESLMANCIKIDEGNMASLHSLSEFRSLLEQVRLRSLEVPKG